MSRETELIQFIEKNYGCTEEEIHDHLYGGYCKAGCDLVRRYLQKGILDRYQDPDSKREKYLYYIPLKYFMKKPGTPVTESKPDYIAEERGNGKKSKHSSISPGHYAGYNPFYFPREKYTSGEYIDPYHEIELPETGPFKNPGETTSAPNTKQMNILEDANRIVYDREKRGEYGDFHENMEEAATIASIMSRKEITAVDAYNVLIGLKLSREGNNHKYDNMLDAIGYMASLNDYKDEI